VIFKRVIQEAAGRANDKYGLRAGNETNAV
jgi:hypothetical protein